MTNTSPAGILIAAAAAALKDRVEEVNKLNVFPVPDGDTGTNMSLTMEAVVGELGNLSDTPGLDAVCKAVTHGSLMGARGNSGVILSQILRGMCDVVGAADHIDTNLLSSALERAVSVSFQAVRKPVEGTMLTVLKDSAREAKKAAKQGASLDAALDRVLVAAFDSVRNTPELLPVLKENGVVDAGGFGLAILAEGLVAAFRGREIDVADVSIGPAPLLGIEPANDWDDDEYLYCTEFLLIGEDIDLASVRDFIAQAGGSELAVGSGDTFKVHVHTDDPGSVLAYMTGIGEVAEVHINNMRQQTAARAEAIRAEGEPDHSGDPAPYGIVSVAAGDGLKAILSSLGVDRIVNGGQTMNPSTAELLEAVASVHAERVLILPNNKNIVMAAQQAAAHADRPVGVVPTRSVPEAFAALFEFDPDAEISENIERMSQAAAGVRTGEVTTAIKNSKGKAGPITAGQVIGIAGGEIEVVGDNVSDVAVELLRVILDQGETVTVLAGEEFPDAELEALEARIAEEFSSVEVESHRGEQPLYPVIVSVE
ncbi:MAG: DAK2 domain-containing protein [Actinomycetota bacterium]|nr:DAK2 domain-containing protein [Actinomycetota bacterium]